MQLTRLAALVAATTLIAGCGAQYTIADRSKLAASRGSQIAAINLLPLPGQLPVGVVTGGLGGGYLVWLLWREHRTGRA